MVEKIETTAKNEGFIGEGEGEYSGGFNPEYQVQGEGYQSSAPLCTRPHPPCTPSYCSGPR